MTAATPANQASSVQRRPTSNHRTSRIGRILTATAIAMSEPTTAGLPDRRASQIAAKPPSRNALRFAERAVIASSVERARTASVTRSDPRPVNHTVVATAAMPATAHQPVIATSRGRSASGRHATATGGGDTSGVV